MNRTFGLLVTGMLLGCSTASSVPEAELGVFYGGQIQELRRVPLSDQPGKDRYGFQVHLGAPVAATTPVTWEIARPARYEAGKWVPAQTEVGHEDLSAGESQFSKVFSFQPGAALGTWNFRVLVGRRLVLDRALEIYDPLARPKVSRKG